MRLETEVDIAITIKYDKWKMIEDHAFNYTPRRCSLSYETDDTKPCGNSEGQTTVVTPEVEEGHRQGTIEENPDVSDSVPSKHNTSEEPEIEFIEVTYV